MPFFSPSRLIALAQVAPSRAALAALQLFVLGDVSRLTGLPSTLLLAGCAFLLGYACVAARWLTHAAARGAW
ncbi:MAG TPA: hypothetical protein VGI11_10200 [Variovorax sp.]|jgi:hypothetical protein